MARWYDSTHSPDETVLSRNWISCNVVGSICMVNGKSISFTARFVTSPAISTGDIQYSLRLFLDTKVLGATGGYPHVATTDSTAFDFPPTLHTHFLCWRSIFSFSFSSLKSAARLIALSHSLSLQAFASFAHNVRRSDIRTSLIFTCPNLRTNRDYTG